MAFFNAAGDSLASLSRMLANWLRSFLPRGGAIPGRLPFFLAAPSAAAGAAGLGAALAAGAASAGFSAGGAPSGLVFAFGSRGFFSLAGLASPAAGASDFAAAGASVLSGD